MSFGFGVGDVVALTQQLTETYQRVKEIGDIDGRLNEVGVAVLELAAAFRTLPDLDIASLEDSEREELGEITQATIKSINAINPILDLLPSRRITSLEFRAPKSSIRDDASLLADKLAPINPSVGRLNILLAVIHSRLSPVILRQRRPEFESRSVPRSGGECNYLTETYADRRLLLRSSGRSWTLNLSWPRSCILIMLLFAIFVALSCFLGVYFTLEKSYGYSMGDAFTLAGWVVAVGAFISSAILAYHHPRCKCWQRSSHRQHSRHDGYELMNLAELPG